MVKKGDCTECSAKTILVDGEEKIQGMKTKWFCRKEGKRKIYWSGDSGVDKLFVTTQKRGFWGVEEEEEGGGKNPRAFPDSVARCKVAAASPPNFFVNTAYAVNKSLLFGLGGIMGYLFQKCLLIL